MKPNRYRRLVPFLCALFALMLAPVIARADSAGTYPTSSGDLTVTTDLSAHHNDLRVTLERNGNSSAQTTVNADPNGGTHDVLNSPEIRCDGGTFKWEGGKLKEKQADGTWKTLRKKRTKGNLPGSYAWLHAGEPAPFPGTLHSPGLPDVPLLRGERAPHSGRLSPGDEITTLPEVPTPG
jgi:hypothetical protein